MHSGTPVEDLMASEVLTAKPDLTVEHVRFQMRSHNVHAVPIVDESGAPLGMITSSDLMDEIPHGTAVSEVMTSGILTIPRAAPVCEAARIMRDRRIHHLVVTDREQVVGIVSSFDLLRLIAE